MAMKYGFQDQRIFKENPIKAIKYIKEFTEKQYVYTRLKSTINELKSYRVIVHGLDDRWQADLFDVIKYSRQKKGYKICFPDMHG